MRIHGKRITKKLRGGSVYSEQISKSFNTNVPQLNKDFKSLVVGGKLKAKKKVFLKL